MSANLADIERDGWRRRAGLAGKRAFDVCASAAGLLVLGPLLLLIALMVRLLLGSPVLFRQQRPGWHGVPFSICKFRTMNDRRDASGELLPDSERLTRFGRFLRKTSLDELPELFDVLRGKMSLVGPRPLLMAYLPRYTPEQFRRHDMRPGITGWAQVNGRQTLKFSKRLEHDVWYVDHWSFLLDLKILLMTFSRVSSGSGVISGQDVEDVDDLGLSAPRAKPATGRNA
ncbi:sugar transferase [Noviherbaspirillum galbum]|uniref:Sugar transferase n=1 Tax=Noviherbaspirillum galbum TaxID=2709383 RepID=A0A6B3SSU0_9BURK|nr:sugar transferase [Noviherbaspirillum galbum]NEX64030.1 sugar transferase [Noviherbaspirillum galbum]